VQQRRKQGAVLREHRLRDFVSDHVGIARRKLPQWAWLRGSYWWFYLLLGLGYLAFGDQVLVGRARWEVGISLFGGMAVGTCTQIFWPRDVAGRILPLALLALGLSVLLMLPIGKPHIPVQGLVGVAGWIVGLSIGDRLARKTSPDAVND
jgi:hypothetical protein